MMTKYLWLLVLLTAGALAWADAWSQYESRVGERVPPRALVDLDKLENPFDMPSVADLKKGVEKRRIQLKALRVGYVMVAGKRAYKYLPVQYDPESKHWEIRTARFRDYLVPD